jgi:hypothetical protein
MGAMKDIATQQMQGDDPSVVKFVVFTGEAYDVHGKAVLRGDLKKLAEANGLVVQSSVQTRTQMVVASRTDTVKAKKAKERGLLVQTYPEFLKSWLGVETVPELGGKYDPNIDAVPDAETLPKKRHAKSTILQLVLGLE